jgi:hypothetical protein
MRLGTTAAADRGPIEFDPGNGGDLRRGGTATAEREVGVLADSHGQSVGLREPGRQGIFRFCDEHSHGPWGTHYLQVQTECPYTITVMQKY